LLIKLCFPRANDYIPNLEETEMLRQCTSRLRMYATAGLIGGGSVVAAVLKVSHQSVQFNRMQKVTWIACSSVVGAFIGVQTAGPACLKQVVALPSSPMANEARRLYVHLTYPSISRKPSIFPPVFALGIQRSHLLSDLSSHF
jgi:hypothetical protein